VINAAEAVVWVNDETHHHEAETADDDRPVAVTIVPYARKTKTG
jgi:hypothetical protein